MENQTMHYRHPPALASIALAAAAVLGLGAPAQAAFPGRNGKIAAAFFDDPGGGAGPARSGIGLLRADRGAAQKRSEVIHLRRHLAAAPPLTP
jgi:hypothetical protein